MRVQQGATAAVHADGPRFGIPLKLDNCYTLKTAVRDALSGAIGMTKAPIHIGPMPAGSKGSYFRRQGLPASGGLSLLRTSPAAAGSSKPVEGEPCPNS